MLKSTSALLELLESGSISLSWFGVLCASCGSCGVAADGSDCHAAGRHASLSITLQVAMRHYPWRLASQSVDIIIVARSGGIADSELGQLLYVAGNQKIYDTYCLTSLSPHVA